MLHITRKNNPNIHVEAQNTAPPIAKDILRKKSKLGRIISDFKLYYPIIVIKNSVA